MNNEEEHYVCRDARLGGYTCCAADENGYHCWENKVNDDMGEISDGYHTFNELYEFRLLYNAALFNEWAMLDLHDVHKSWHHADDKVGSIFGKNWFVVVAELPTGQISNHYAPEHWNLFRVPERGTANVWDGHSSADVVVRMRKYLKGSYD